MIKLSYVHALVPPACPWILTILIFCIGPRSHDGPVFARCAALGGSIATGIEFPERTHLKGNECRSSPPHLALISHETMQRALNSKTRHARFPLARAMIQDSNVQTLEQGVFYVPFKGTPDPLPVRVACKEQS